jgi:hypothetical protein
VAETIAGTDPFEGLDFEAVDWAGLTHAYGGAEDVPVLIRSLMSPDSGEWRPKAARLTQADYPFGVQRDSLLRCGVSGGAVSTNVWADDVLNYRKRHAGTNLGASQLAPVSGAGPAAMSRDADP